MSLARIVLAAVPTALLLVGSTGCGSHETYKYSRQTGCGTETVTETRARTHRQRMLVLSDLTYTQEYPPLDSRSQPSDVAQKGPVYYNRGSHLRADPRYYMPWTADTDWNQPFRSEVRYDETPYRFDPVEPNRYHPYAH